MLNSYIFVIKTFKKVQITYLIKVIIQNISIH